MYLSTETICAPITAPVSAAVGVIRLSGEKALEISKQIFSKPDKIGHGKVVYGSLYYKGELIDTCLVSYFKAPMSYTGEDVVEISVHGSVSVMAHLLEVLIELGARKAGPGEFTKRAFVNGKMDLTQAESVMELIDAQSDAERKAASSHMGGATFKMTEEIRLSLLDIASSLGAYIDYPDEEIDELERSAIEASLADCLEKANGLIERCKTGKVIKDGITTAILGKTNAGKSSLMNMLSGYDRSIVTDMEGTTRDLIENTVMLGSAKLILTDTAGLRKTDNKAEKIGIDLSENAAKNASLCLCVFDLSRPLNEEDYRLEALTKNQNRIGVFNKTDITSSDLSDMEKLFDKKVYISAKTGQGKDELTALISEMFLKGLPADGNVIMSARQYSQLIKMKEELSEAQNALKTGVTLDAVGVCIDGAIDAAGEITGHNVTEDTVHRIFERFCVGK